MHEDQAACTSVRVFIESRWTTLSAALIFEGCRYLKISFLSAGMDQIYMSIINTWHKTKELDGNDEKISGIMLVSIST